MQKLTLLLFTILCSLISFAQPLIGIKNVPGDYPDLAAAVTALNANGVGINGVTINVNAAQSFTNTLSSPGYLITATGTARDQIVIKGNGNTITNTGNSSVLIDAAFSLNGCDFVTIDNFVINGDINTDYGIGVFQPSASNGAKNNTISNCVITLNKTNTNSVGVMMDHKSNISGGTVFTITSITGTNSNNKFYSNTIQNCYNGYILKGYGAAPAPYDLYDQKNEIGKVGSKRSQILNFGGSTLEANGILTEGQNDINIFETNINSRGGTDNQGSLFGISNKITLNANVDISYDTISLQIANNAAADLYAINNLAGGAGAGNAVNIHHNIIQNCASTTNFTVGVYGIFHATGATNSKIYNNKISGNSFAGNGVLACIYYSGSSLASVLSVNINDNEINNNSKTGSSGDLFMIYADASTNNTKCSNNTLFNNNNNSSGSGRLYGYFSNVNGSLNEEISNNQIYNCNGGSGETEAIYARGGNGQHNKSIFSNTIYAISGGGPTGAIYIDRANKALVYKNNIYNITSFRSGSSSVPALHGIAVGTNNNLKYDIYNNLISELKTPTCSAGDAIYGMWIQGGVGIGQINIYHNTVYLNATSTSNTFGSSAVFIGANPASVGLRNNILVNRSVSNLASSNSSSAIARAASTFTNYNLTSGNNCLHAGTPSNVQLLYVDGSFRNQTIQAFKNIVNPRDQASFTEIPPFVNITSSPYDLHLTSAVTQCESGGQPITAVTTDFDGVARNANFPDVGAYEFAGNTNDIASPDIQYELLNNDIVSPSRNVNLFATITDPSFINTTTGTSPRLYYKKKTQLNTYNGNTSSTDGWKYVEATNTTSPFSFLIDYTKLFSGGVVATDIIQYFVTAQDLNATPRISLNAGAFTVQPTSVNLTAAAFPLTGIINQYSITGNVFTGVVNVGSTETITSLTNVGGLFEALKTGVVLSDLTVNITSDLLMETGQFALSNFSELGIGKYNIKFVSSTATLRTIEGSSASAALIRLDSADRVTFDGNVAGSGKYLLFRNTSFAAPVFLFVNDAQNNTIRNCIIESSNTTASGSNNLIGALVIGNSNILNGTGNDENIITYNEIRDRSDIVGTPLIAINAIGSTNTIDIYNSNNIISNNNIHDFYSGTINLIAQSGIWIQAGNTNYNIDSNSLYQTAARAFTNTGTIIRAISLPQAVNNSNIGGHKIRHNFIGGNAPNAGTNGNYWTMSSTGNNSVSFAGILVSTGTIPSEVSNNVVKNIDLNTVATPTVSATNFVGIGVGLGKFSVLQNQVGSIIGNDSLKITINTNASVNGEANFIGMYSFSPSASTVYFANNKVGGITLAGTTTGTVSSQFILATNSPIANPVFEFNTIGSTITPNSISTNFTANPKSTLFGIQTLINNGTAPKIENNIISNITDNSTHINSQAIGISVSNTSVCSESPIISKNEIKNIQAAGLPLASVQTVQGITMQNYSGKNANISSNKISGLRASAIGNFRPYTIGILISNASSGGIISNNKIFDLTNLASGSTASIFGINLSKGNSWEIYNNMISLQNAANTNEVSIVGILDSTFSGSLKTFYNSIYIGGQPSSGSQNSYGFLRAGNAITNFKNNLVYNNRKEGIGFSFAIGNNFSNPTDGWLPGSANYNTYIVTNINSMGNWNNIDKDFASWKTISIGDRESYADLTTNVPLSNLFNGAITGDLSINKASVESWYVNGKALAGGNTNQIGFDFEGDVRNIIEGIPTDIGADEFTPNAGVLPPSAIASAAPAANTTTSFSFAGRKLGEIIWGASVPATIDWKYYSGVLPTSPLGNFIHSYHDVPATGSGAYNYDMKLYYTTAEQKQIADASLSGAKKNATAPWITIGGGATIDNDGKFVTSTGLSSFSLFSLHDVSIALPVKLISFDGYLNTSNTVDLKWVVDNQVNINYYEVQRSIDNILYKKITVVNANNLNSFTYDCNDAQPIIGKNYYRLKIVENDGRINYSQIVVVNFIKNQSLSIYPMPVGSTLNIVNFNASLVNTKAQIINSSGQLVKEILIKNTYETIDVSSLTPGNYFIKTINGETKKIIKQ